MNSGERLMTEVNVQLFHEHRPLRFITGHCHALQEKKETMDIGGPLFDDGLI